MNRAIKIALGIGFIFLAMQFIRPARNHIDRVLAADISKTINVPESVWTILKNACYDCHSDSTFYPWYSNIVPAGWLMANHIKQGKEELNFSEFGGYSSRRQISKLDGIANSIRDDIMPLWSYKLMHKNALLSTFDKTLIIDWAQRSKESLSAKK